MKNGGSFHSYVAVYQRVDHHPILNPHDHPAREDFPLTSRRADQDRPDVGDGDVNIGKTLGGSVQKVAILHRAIGKMMMI